MKKFIFTIAALIFGLSQMTAQEMIFPEIIEVPQGGSALLTIKYKTGVNIVDGTEVPKTITTYMFDFVLPKGLTLAQGDAGMDWKQDSNNKGFTPMPNGTTGLACLSSNVETIYLKGSDGTLGSVVLEAAASLAIGTELEVKATQLAFSEYVGGTYETIPFDDATITVKIIENRVPFDEMAESMPSYDASGTNNVKFTRSFQAGKWNTLVLPFTMTYADFKVHFGEDVELAQWKGWTLTGYNSSDNTASAIELTFTAPTENQLNKQGIVGGTIYLVKTSKSKVDFSLDGVNIVDKVTTKTITDEEDSWEDAVLKGTFVKSTVPANGVFISSNKFYYSTGSTIMKGFRAWFEIPITIDSASGAKVSFRVDDETTSIEGLNLNSMNEGVYDLSGRKIKLENGDVTKLQKGVYIIDGKKVTIK